MTNCLLQLRSIVWLAALLIAAPDFVPNSTDGGEPTKPAWPVEWEKIVAAAKKEGQVAVYISGYEEVLPEFKKEYPEINVLTTSGRGSQVGQKLLAERRAE